ncbi:MAG: hypothetical protein ACR2OO_16730 [Thermomicrobiales bacterium]
MIHLIMSREGGDEEDEEEAFAQEQEQQQTKTPSIGGDAGRDALGGGKRAPGHRVAPVTAYSRQVMV